MIEVEKRLADLAAGQWGLITTPQATTLGITHSQLTRLADNEVMARLAHGVYRLRSAPADRHAELRAAWLALEPKLTAGQRLQNPSDGPVVSHASAAYLRDWGDLSAYVAEFTFDGRKQTRREDIRIHRGPTPPEDIEIVSGLPTTTAERLIIDLLATSHDTDHIGAVLAGAIRARAIDLEHLATRSAPYAARRGFARASGSELVNALVQSGNAQDEAAADSLVRLANVFRANIPEASISPAARSAMPAVQQISTNMDLSAAAQAARTALQQNAVSTAARLVAESGVAEVLRAMAESELTHGQTRKNGWRVPTEQATMRAIADAQQVLAKPTARRAIADARKLT